VQVLEGREQDIKEIREVLTEREEELAAATNRVAVLEAAQGETHDQLEETMQNIDRDNADKEADLVAANREVEEVRSCERLMLTYRQLGQRVLELEEGIETFRIRERDLNADLRSADEAFENAKTHYENLVNALKEARRKLQDERDGALVDAKLAQEKRVVDKDAWRKENLDEAEKHRRILADKDQVCRSHVGGNKDNPIQINARLQTELEAARDRVAQRDRDLLSVQTALRSLETERRKLGVEHTSDRFSLELEMERVKRDLAAAEDELDRARGEVDAREETLRQRDLERAQLVRRHSVRSWSWLNKLQLDKLRDLEARLASERQGRLNLSDKLDIANKVTRRMRDAIPS